MWLESMSSWFWFSALRISVRTHGLAGEVPSMVVTPLINAFISAYLMASQARFFLMSVS